jgi:hypothetical protein
MTIRDTKWGRYTKLSRERVGTYGMTEKNVNDFVTKTTYTSGKING